MVDPRPIGVFDSGVGGLSVLREIRALLPAESLLYCADSGHAPYGEKSQDFIRARSLALAEFLIGQGAKALVVACNTATAAAARTLRETWPDMPIIGMEPAVKPAAKATRSGVVGVLATTGTLASAQFAALLDSFGREIRVVTRPGQGLVECVERGALEGAETEALLRSHLEPLLTAGADTIVLGCTHYVFLRELCEAIVGPHVAVIDTGAAVARQLQRRLQDGALLATTPTLLTRFWSSGDLRQAQHVLRVLWHADSDCAPLPAAQVS